MNSRITFRMYLLRLLVSGVSLCLFPASLVAEAGKKVEQTQTRSGGFMYELIPIGSGVEINSKEASAVLGDIQKGVVDRASATDVSAIEDHLSSHSASPYRASLLLNAGLILYHEGSYSRALKFFERAWESVNKDKFPGEDKNRLTSKIGVELGGLYARLGRKTELANLLVKLETCPIEGKEALALTSLQQALFLMNKHPETSFKCGPLAMLNLWLETNPGKPVPQAIEAARSEPSGFSLEELEKLSSQTELILRAVKSEDVPVPSVIHWKAGHYAVVLSKSERGYHVQDPTFLTDFHMSEAAMREEASGYYLIPNSSTTTNSSAVSVTEKRSIRGRGAPSAQDTADQCDGSDNCNTEAGMPVASFNDFYVSLIIRDIPLVNKAPFGPDTRVELTYNQNANADHLSGYYGNVGKRWFLSWNRYVEDNSPTSSWTNGSTCKLIRENGNIETFTVPSFASGSSSASGTYSKSSLIRQGTSTAQFFRRNLPDGSVEIYGRQAAYPASYSGPKPARYFLTEQIDPQGNKLTFIYDDNTSAYNGNKLREVRDANNLATTIQYNVSGFPELISSITDPFERKVKYEYTTSQRLQKVTDVEDITTTFAYGDDIQTDFVTSMTTPYGTSTFAKETSSSTGSWLTLTDPKNRQEKIHFRYSFNDTGFSTYPLAGVSNTSAATVEVPTTSGISIANNIAYYGYPYYGVTLHWDEKTMAHFPPNPSTGSNFNKAHQTRWAQKTSSFQVLAGVPSSRRPALSHREWYNYEGQPNAGTIGKSNQPTLSIRRIKDENGAYQDEITRQEYNALGNPTKSTDPLGRENLTEYATTGLGKDIDVTAIKRKRGAAYETLSSFAGYANRRPGSSTDAAGKTTGYLWNTRGQITRITDPNLHETRFNYNSLGQLETVTRSHPDTPVGQAGTQVTMATYTYDPKGRVRTMTDSSNYTVTLTHDNLDRVTRMDYPDGTFEQTTYTAIRPTQFRDRAGRITVSTYDGNGQLETFTDPLQRKWIYTWCACGSLQTLTDPENRQTKWQYDILGRLTEKEYADASKDTYGYHPESGWLKSLKRAADAGASLPTEDYAYKIDGQMAKIDYSEAATADVTWTYDPVDGRAATMVDGTGSTIYTYHPIAGAPQGADKLWKINGPLANDTLEMVYDTLSRQTGLRTLADGGSIVAQQSAIFDALGRLKTVTNPLGSFARTYEGLSDRTTLIDGPGGIDREFAYHGNTGDRRLQSITNRTAAGASGVVSAFDYVYNPLGRITEWGLKAGTADRLQWSFLYNPSGELTDATQRNPLLPAIQQDLAYRYDGAGNRRAVRTGNAWEGYQVNSLNQLQKTGSSVSLGRITGRVNEVSRVSVQGVPALVRPVAGTSEYEFESAPGVVADAQGRFTVRAEDASGQVNQKTFQTPATPSGTVKVEIAYDGDGNTERRTLLPGQAGTLETRYAWDGAGRMTGIQQGPVVTPIKETQITYDGLSRRVRLVDKTNGAVTSDKRYVWSGLSLLEERDAAGTATLRRFYEEGEQRIGSTDAGSYYYFRDHLGSVREMVSDTGVLRVRYNYSLYGERTKATGDLDTEMGYTGHWYHSASNLHFAPYRSYDAELGRWTSRDPIAEMGGINLYGYVNNNPLNFIDPEGKTPWGVGLGLGIGITTAGLLEGTAALGIGVGIYLWADNLLHPDTSLPTQLFSKPKPGSKPKNCPAGTMPIDQSGLSHDQIHDIKPGVGAGAADWTGIDPNGNVITGDSDGNAVDNGPWTDYTDH